MEKIGIDDLINGGMTQEDLAGLPRKDLWGQKLKINAGNKDLAVISEEAWLATQVANKPPFLFRHCGLPSRIERDDDGVPIIQVLTQDRLRYVLARVAEWYVERKKVQVSASPPCDIVRDMLARPEPPLPVLTRIIASPVFAPDGSLELEPGYHAASQTYFAPAQGFAIPPVSKHPGRDEIDRAKALILTELLSDFPFAAEADRSHALALALLPFARDLINGSTPLHLIEKPTPGTGGSLLAGILAFPFLGRPLSTLTEGKEEDEWRKRITAKLKEGPAVLLIDNVRRRLESSALSAAITSPIWEDRILGQSDMIRIPVRCVWMATGNNPSLSSEMSRRTIRIRMDARVDRPWLREEFRHPELVEWVSLHRSELVWACLTLIQTWIAAGRPKGAARLGMFEQWAMVIGGILEVLKIPNFLGNLSEFYEQEDTESAVWRELFARWWGKYEGVEVGIADLYPLVISSNADPIDLELGDGSERSQRTRLGKRLGDVRDRQYGEYRIVQGGKRQGAQLWRLVPTGKEGS